MQHKLIPARSVNKLLLITNTVIALVYFSWWLVPGHQGNPWLFGMLLAGEVYHVLMALTFWYTLWPRKMRRSPHYNTMLKPPSVDIFIPVAGEPVEIVRETIRTAKHMTYPSFSVYILNDGYVAGKSDWREMERLAKEMGVHCITRRHRGGAKAGNINNALRKTKGEIVVLFDADMAPYPHFLSRVTPFFSDPKMGFVQTPQYYKNHAVNDVAGASWEQQELFFGPIMIGKDSTTSSFICGTNVAIRRTALMEVGGMTEDSIAEDFLTSLFIHQKGWISRYIPEILTQGLAPEDLKSYVKQQFRWARGSLEILFWHNPIFSRGLDLRQKTQYLSSALFYFNGLIVLIDMIVPIISLVWGLRAVSASTTSFALFFIPFMYFTLYTLYIGSNERITFRAMSFTQSSFVLQIIALRSVLLRERTKFVVTPKEAQRVNTLPLITDHLFYAVLGALAAAVGIAREGFSPSVITNIVWIVFNIGMFTPYIRTALAADKKASTQARARIPLLTSARSTL